MEKFKYIREISSSTFNRVYEALNLETGEVVAIKQIYKRMIRNWHKVLGDYLGTVKKKY